MKLTPPRAWLFPTVCLIITSYFIYHGIQGARGYRRMNQLNEEILLARQIADDTRSEKELLETKVKSLSPNALDLDQLEESALRVLNMGSPQDQVIFLDN